MDVVAIFGEGDVDFREKIKLELKALQLKNQCFWCPV